MIGNKQLLSKIIIQFTVESILDYLEDIGEVSYE